MKTSKFKTIKCPRCDCEYLPAEIFYPKHFFGDVKDITRDYSGKIISFMGNSLNLSETYVCDRCGTALKVYARVNFEAVIDEACDFDHDYVSKPAQKFTLAEE